MTAPRKRKAREWDLCWSSEWKTWSVVPYPCNCGGDRDPWSHIRVREVPSARAKKDSAPSGWLSALDGEKKLAPCPGCFGESDRHIHPWCPGNVHPDDGEAADRKANGEDS